ncbi:hypothetical protein PMZ80_005045 [Knufia obscura]|uniref:Uncharacterized protein n=2 Tax=Knufia TaxID=430999 RepID=A0AAN8I749_9EURO|nr:hypothetical protein PMZ80_005045 [Knufia obscura]KAK5957707.1 hypothetical protein OHC33_000896 [Knufia fluminis]
MFTVASKRLLVQARPLVKQYFRPLSTLRSNPNIKVFQSPSNPQSHILSLLSTDPPTVELAVGEATEPEPDDNPRSFKENPKFLQVLHSVIAEHAHQDPQVKSQAAAMASSSGATFMQVNRRTNTGSSGASDQAGAGSGGQGGWIHVSDNRHPPDFGRIAEPEDIFGSVEVDGNGAFTDGTGRYQESGTYRVCTRDGVLGLPDFLRSKLVERLKVEEAAIRNKK